MKKIVLTSLVLAAASAASAADTLIAGWNFGQFVGAGEPSLDWQNYTAVGSAEANYHGTYAPAISTSGVWNSQQGTDPVVAPSFGSGANWYWDGTNGSGAFNSGTGVQIFENNAANNQNILTVSGTLMNQGDQTNNGLRFTQGGVKFSITADTSLFTDTITAPNLSFAAFAVGSPVTIEWFVNGAETAFDMTVIATGSTYGTVYTVDLPEEFYGSATASIQGRLTGAGNVTLDNVHINGGVSAVPEPSSFAAIAGLAGIGFAASRRRRGA